MPLRRRRLYLTLAAVLAVAAFVLFMLLGPPLPGKGLVCEIEADGLDNVAALAFDSNGALYATLERTRHLGELVRFTVTGREVVLSGLDKPDGLLWRGDTLFITSEIGDPGLTAFDGHATRAYHGVQQGEGIALAADGRLLVVEDRETDGRLLRVDPDSGDIDVLHEPLANAEGVCASPDGGIWFVEKGASSLSHLTARGVQAIEGELVHPAFLNCLADGSILVTEDRNRFGRLIRYRDGRFETLIRNLRAPQMAVVGTDGALYIAEQNRDRVLRCTGL